MSDGPKPIVIGISGGGVGAALARELLRDHAEHCVVILDETNLNHHCDVHVDVHVDHCNHVIDPKILDIFKPQDQYNFRLYKSAISHSHLLAEAMKKKPIHYRDRIDTGVKSLIRQKGKKK